MDGLCLSVVNDVIGKIEIRMLGGRDPSFCESKMWGFFEGITVRENDFHIYDPKNHVVLYVAKNIHFPPVFL